MIEPPFIGNFLAFILFLILIYITLYAIYLKLDPPIPIPASQRNAHTKAINQKTIRPIKQNYSLPSIFNRQSSNLLDLSIVIILEPRFNPYHSCQLYKNAYSVFDDILNYFQGKNISYEVIIVLNDEITTGDESFININDQNNDYQDINEFIIQNPEFKILNVKTDSSNRAWQAAFVHACGRLIFNFSPYEEIPFNTISKFINKINSGKKYGKEVLAIGSWKPRNPEEVFQTNLSSFSDYILDLMHSIIDIKPSGYHHCFSFMMTREAAVIILSNLVKFNSFYFIETLFIADTVGTTIKVVNLDKKNDAVIERPSLDKLDEILTFFLSILLYKFNFWKISRSPIQLNSYLSS